MKKRWPTKYTMVQVPSRYMDIADKSGCGGREIRLERGKTLRKKRNRKPHQTENERMSANLIFKLPGEGCPS